jgi:hypothetical protein
MSWTFSNPISAVESDTPHSLSRSHRALRHSFLLAFATAIRLERRQARSLLREFGTAPVNLLEAGLFGNQ